MVNRNQELLRCAPVALPGNVDDSSSTIIIDEEGLSFSCPPD